MSVEYRRCDDCMAGEHDHEGACRKNGTVTIQTFGKPLEKPARCGCDAENPVGVKDADTQREVSFAG